ncbi:hypothetical protein [Leptospira idonii]|uniref:TRL-like family protein n=1 Tax=Leptospira idonii TaxID=1193500 RepID=A0A4R9M577_9LEPT|nr:hypothetical protein [Leptospira idonii]TGN20965.1 hypothetical protein EHS15_00125 [Leptospira idonii]
MNWKLMFLISLISLSFGCKSSPYWGNFERISLEAVPNTEDLDEPVSGYNCALFWYEASLAKAVQSAIAKVPGATALRDVTFKVSAFCIVATGIPVKDKSGQAEKPK